MGSTLTFVPSGLCRSGVLGPDGAVSTRVPVGEVLGASAEGPKCKTTATQVKLPLYPRNGGTKLELAPAGKLKQEQKASTRDAESGSARLF